MAKTKESQTAKATRLFKEGKKKEALKIFKTFKSGLTKEEKRVIGVASELDTVGEGTYKQMGMDVKAIREKAYKVIEDKFVKE